MSNNEDEKCNDKLKEDLLADTSELISQEIPPGVDAGMQLRIPGEGSAGPFGGPRGDLVVSTRVPEHPFFVRKGDSNRHFFTASEAEFCQKSLEYGYGGC